jgi:hypothetical protein
LSDIDPNAREEVRTTYEAGRPTVTEVRRVESRPSAAGWIAAGLVAAIAIVAVGFVYYSQSSATAPTTDQLNAASDQGRAQGFVEGAQNAAANQAAVNQAAGQSAQVAAQGEADRAAANRQAAEDAANRAQAANAAANGRDAAATVDAPPANPPSN